jgi:hypothetical protein
LDALVGAPLEPRMKADEQFPEQSLCPQRLRWPISENNVLTNLLSSVDSHEMLWEFT